MYLKKNHLLYIALSEHLTSTFKLFLVVVTNILLILAKVIMQLFFCDIHLYNVYYLELYVIFLF